MMSQHLFRNVVCGGCGLACDDVEVLTDGEKILTTRNACIIGAHRFGISVHPSRYLAPLIRNEKGERKEVSLTEAFKKAADILLESKHPLLYGWSSTTCETQRLGIQLAKQLKGVIDGSSSVSYGATLRATSKCGLFTSTLGQVKNRANLIIFWGCNAMDSHPRQLSRCAEFPVGFFNQGRADRKVTVIDVGETETSKLADRFIKIEPETDCELLAALRLALKGEKIPETVAGVNAKEISDLAEEMKKAAFGVIFFGTDHIASNRKHFEIEHLISLVRELNQTAKFVAIGMRNHFNEAGLSTMLLRETGFQFGVDFGNRTGQSFSGETTAADVLARGSCDAALIMSSDPFSNLPLDAARQLTKIPLIVIEPHWTPTAELADVVIPTAISGIEAEGTVYRMDGVPLHLKKVVNPPTNCLSDEMILQNILKEVCARAH